MDILAKLERAQIVSFSLASDGKTLIVVEECDKYYDAYLNKMEVAGLIAQLQSLHDVMN